jgi:hypothetical protein
MTTPVRYPNGVTNAAKNGPLAMIGMPDPSKYISFFEDFAGNMSFPVAASALAAASNGTWTITVTEGGAGDAASAVSDVNGGAVTLTTDAADNDLIFVQHKNECFLPTAGKKLFFKIKFSLTDANAVASSVTQAEWYAGLMVRDTDPLSSTAGDGVTDGIFFMSEDGTQDIYLHCQKNATTGQLSTLLTDTLTVATQTEFAFYFDGARWLSVFKDGVKTKDIDLTTTLTTYLPDTELALSFGVKNGEAVAKVLTVDYVFVAQER